MLLSRSWATCPLRDYIMIAERGREWGGVGAISNSKFQNQLSITGKAVAIKVK
jgi:hypothetical protein